MKTKAKVNSTRKPSKKYKADMHILFNNNSKSKEKFEETKEKSSSGQDSMNVDRQNFLIDLF